MQNTYRANLGAAEFPFLSELQGRNIMIPGIDQNYSRQANSPKNKDRDIGIPQIYYCHNVMPTDAGMMSVSYQAVTAAPVDTDGLFTDQFYLRDANDNAADLGITSSGRNYVRLSIAGGWLRTTDKTPTTGNVVTTAYVNGITYIAYGGVGVFKYNFGTNALDVAALTGLTAANVLGICASNGYMIAWTANTVVWSSLIDPTDFTPSLITGAGGGAVQSAKASIVGCLPMNNGFIVYTKKNAVAAVYSGNSQYPFNFKEIIGAGGLSNIALVTYEGNSTNHYSYTTNGLQEINSTNSAIAFPQLTDFISGAKFEDFNELTNVFTSVPLGTAIMKKKLTLVANRYLVFSYGIAALTHALIYDFSLARWGKLKTQHVDCFEYSYPSGDVVETPKRSIGFLQADGTILITNIAYDTTNSYGVVITGKYQMDRNHYLEMQEIHLESIQVGNMITVKLLSTIDGKNYSVVNTTLATNVGDYRKYNCRSSGLNHSIVISGAFHVHSMELKFADAGEVRT